MELEKGQEAEILTSPEEPAVDTEKNHFNPPGHPEPSPPQAAGLSHMNFFLLLIFQVLGDSVLEEQVGYEKMLLFCQPDDIS